MFNLLPQPEKDALRLEYRTRLAVVWLWFFLATLLIAVALLLPSYVFSVQKEKVAARRVEMLSHVVTREEATALFALLAEAQSKATRAKDSPPSSFSERIAAVARETPAGISLSGFSLALVGEEGKQPFFIHGIAAERNVLVSFARELERTGLFEKVEVPLPLLAKESGIEFSLRVAGSF